MTDWYQEWFGEDYLRLYPHRDDAEAQRAIALVAGIVPLAGRQVLDLACGQGRHSGALAELGARVTGLDLSSVLLRRARERLGNTGRLVRGDMRRLPFRTQSLDVVVNLFTSFGYFADDGDHAAVLAEVARILRSRGTFVIDYFNAARVARELVPEEMKTVGGNQVTIRRHITQDGRFVVKEMTPPGQRCFVERVRLFSAQELEQLLEGAGLRVLARFGDYDGAPLAPDATRTILAATRN